MKLINRTEGTQQEQYSVVQAGTRHLSKLNGKVSIFILFLLLFFLFLPFRHLDNFIDEIDNFLGGMIVAAGGDVYKDFPSQHTPLMYYICAIFRVLGAASILEFRIFSYLFLSAVFVGLYVRYSKFFGKVPLFTYLITFIATLIGGELAGAGPKFLSEQVQAQALVILFLELLLYLRNTEHVLADNQAVIRISSFSLGSVLAISLGVFFSIGTAFVSVYAVSVYLLSLVLLEFLKCRKQSSTIVQAAKQAASNLSPLFLVIGLPFLALTLWYYFSDNLGNAYQQAYYLNTTVYSKYIGNLGTDKISAAINPFYFYALTAKSKLFSLLSGMNGILTQPSESGLKQFFRDFNFLLCIFINFSFLFWISRKYRTWFRIVVVGIVSIFLIETGIRGFIGFHALAYWAISLVMGAILLEHLFLKTAKHGDKKKPRFSLVKPALLIVVFVFLFTPYAVMFFRNILPTSADWGKGSQTDYYQHYIEKLTTQNDKIYIQHLESTYLYINTNRLPASRQSVTVPWFAELYENQVLRDLSQTMPKLIIYHPKENVWGYVYEKFAANLDQFIREHYTVAPLKMPIWVRKDLLPEAIEMLGENYN